MQALKNITDSKVNSNYNIYSMEVQIKLNQYL